MELTYFDSVKILQYKQHYTIHNWVDYGFIIHGHKVRNMWKQKNTMMAATRGVFEASFNSCAYLQCEVKYCCAF